MEWKLFADLAEVAGERTHTVEQEVETTGEALQALLEDYPDLQDRIIDDSGALVGHVSLLRNGETITGPDQLEEPVDPGDELALFPPVSGG